MRDASTYDPTCEELFGTPEQILHDGGLIPLNPPPLRQLVGRCLRCTHTPTVSKFRFKDEVVSAGDWDVTPSEWEYATATAHHGRGRRFRFHCDGCGLVTAHIPWGIR